MLFLRLFSVFGLILFLSACGSAKLSDRQGNPAGDGPSVEGQPATTTGTPNASTTPANPNGSDPEKDPRVQRCRSYGQTPICAPCPFSASHQVIFVCACPSMLEYYLAHQGTRDLTSCIR